MLTTRRSFLSILGVGTLAVPTLARHLASLSGTLAPDSPEIVAALSRGQWGNGIPYWTGLKAAQDNTALCGQILLCWSPIMPYGRKVQGRLTQNSVGRVVPWQFFYANAVVEQKDWRVLPVSEKALTAQVWRAQKTLRHIVRQHHCPEWRPVDERPTEKMLAKLVRCDVTQDIVRWQLDRVEAA